MKYELNAYATNGNQTVKFFENDGMTELHARYFHVTFEDKYHTYDFDAHFNTYAPAEELFKKTVLEYGFKQVYISDEYMKWLTYEPDYDAPPTQEEEYAEACMAEACGDSLLMERYNRKYGVEKEYSPSNPWDAPGMKVSDFI